MKLTRSILITGSSRGIGLELARQLAPLTETLIASCRTPDTASDLQEIVEENENVKILPLDATQHWTFPDVAEEVSGIVGSQGLNLLINNAGISPRATKVNLVTAEQMEETYKVNTIAPLMLTKALLPLLKEAAQQSNSEEGEYAISNAAVLNISSVLGSLAENTGDHSGGLYPYRCSKAALNMMTRSLCADLKPYNITVFSMHPGWVRTDMGGANAPLSTEQSVEGIVTTLLNLNSEHNGQFLRYDGEIIPW